MKTQTKYYNATPSKEGPESVEIAYLRKEVSTSFQYFIILVEKCTNEAVERNSYLWTKTPAYAIGIATRVRARGKSKENE